MAEPSVELIQFPYSHYNEKVRWALDYKRVPHRRTSLLPGPHAPRILVLTGQTAVPVLRFADARVHGSARIIEELERRFPDPPLYPTDPALRTRALEIQAWFDEEIGPRIRRALFAVMLDEPDYVCNMFSAQRSAPVRALYRAAFPLTRAIMKKNMGIRDPASIDDALRATAEALDFVAKEAGAEGFLVGDRFSVADLTAAALLAPAADPPDSPMARPQPAPESLRAWSRRWQERPGVAWVLDQYQRHRPPSAAI